MAKVCIIREDVEKLVEASVNELINRYSTLTQTPHELYLVLNDRVLGEYFKEFPKGHLMKRLMEAGFKQENMSYRNMTFEVDKFPEADIYFCDAEVPEPEWTPNSLRIAERLDRNRCYINSNNCAVTNPAEEKGYNVLFGQSVKPADLEKMLESLK